jgi:hypothetical protein
MLKILKTKSTTLSNDLFLCQVSKGSAVWSEFNLFCTLVTMATAAILNVFNPSKAATHYGVFKMATNIKIKAIVKNSKIFMEMDIYRE